MGARPRAPHTDELPRPRLDEQLKMSHPVVRLSQLMNWDEIERRLGAHFISNRGHALDETIEQVEILAEQRPGMAIVDKGYRGAQVQGGQIPRSGPPRGITRALKAMINRRCAIEPAIGHMKTDGRLARCPLKGAR